MADDSERQKFRKLFQDLDSEIAKEIDESVLKIVDHVHSRVSYTEDKRKSAIQVSLGFIAFAGPLVVLLYQYAPDWFLLFVPFFLCLLFVGFLDLVLYIVQEIFTRPFIGNAMTWRWFYHYCIRPTMPVGPFLPWAKEKKADESRLSYLEGLVKYAENTVRATSQQFLAQDIEQLFILLTTEKFKNEWLKQQQRILFYGLLASVVASMVAFIANSILSLLPSCRSSIERNLTLVPVICGLELGSNKVILVLTVAFAAFAIFMIACKNRVFQPTASRKQWDYLSP